MEFRLTVDVRTALAIGAGPQVRGGVSRAARDLDGYPVVPASTLKGAMRTTAERLLRGSSHPAAGQICSSVGGKGACMTADAACVVCTLFGGAGRSGILRFGDARVTDEILRTHLNPARHGTVGTDLRGGVALDRASRSASDHAHAGRETTAPFMTGFRLTARVETLRGLSEDELTVLRAAARGVTALGGERSRGAGQARLDLSGPVERPAVSPRGAAPRPGRVGAAPAVAKVVGEKRERPGPASAPADAAQGASSEASADPDGGTSEAPAGEDGGPLVGTSDEAAVESATPETTPASAPGAAPTSPRAAAPAGAFRVMLTAREAFRTAPNAGKSGGFVRASDRVPGSTLRGAIAAALAAKLEHGFDNPVFKRAFSEGLLRVTDAIPAGRRVAPVTLSTCNAHPGFHLRSGNRVPRSLVSHGGWDLLLVDFLRAKLGSAKPWPWTGRCPLAAETGATTCPGTLVPLAAPYLTQRVADDQTAPFSAVTSHRAVDRAAGRSARALLHGAEATLPGKGISRYEGEVSGADPEIAAALAGLSELRIGGGIANGRGLFNVHLEPGDAHGVRAALSALESAVARLLETWPGGAVTRTEVGLDRHRLAILDLASDWVPSRWLGSHEETVAADLTGIPGISILSTNLTVSEASGWNAAAGLAKPLRRTFARGGVVLASYALIHEDQVIEALEALAHRGVGRLTTEGYGQIRVADPVHWERIPPLMEGR